MNDPLYGKKIVIIYRCDSCDMMVTNETFEQNPEMKDCSNVTIAATGPCGGLFFIDRIDVGNASYCRPRGFRPE